VQWIEVVCEQTAGGEKTRAEITYTYLGLTDRGNSLSKEALELMFDHDLGDWEEAVNHFLETGVRKHLR